MTLAQRPSIDRSQVRAEPAHRPHRWTNPIARYTRWLHTMWPAGTVEKLPEVNSDGSTRIPGVYVVGDLTGVPLLKFSSDTGARAVQTIVNESGFRRSQAPDVLDLIIIGAGISGMAAALEARKHKLRFEVFEASEPFSTIVNFPKAKPIYTYPSDMTPAGELQFHANVKEPLVEELRAQTRDIQPRASRCERISRTGGVLEVQFARDQSGGGAPPIRAQRVIVAIGRSGNFRKLGVPGEDLGKVYNRLHDPKDFADKDVLVVGGGDSALETAIALAECGGRVTLSYRKPEFSRPKPENVEKLDRLTADPTADVQVESPSSERVTTAMGGYMGPYRAAGSIVLMLSSKIERIDEGEVRIVDAQRQSQTIANDAVFTMIGREAPLEFFRRSGIPIRGEWTAGKIISMVLFVAFCVFVYHWKKSGVYLGVFESFQKHGWFPFNVESRWSSLGEAFGRHANILGTIKVALGQPGFYYSLAYCTLVTTFGVARIRRRRTPYVTWQTLTLMVIQIVPLFLLPYLFLPWAGFNGWFDHGGALGWFADHLFPRETYDAYGREYWRSFGLILAWPLFVYNLFVDNPSGGGPVWAWVWIGLTQTFVIIPGMIYFWGKGAYCGWICSCGALAETMGDRHREKMPHGPFWNRLNMIGQAFLLFAFVLLALRVVTWFTPAGGWIQDASGQWIEQHPPGSGLHKLAAESYEYLFHRVPILNYAWFVDLLWAGILGVGLYFWFSGRVWCRFACPLAALMHIYARFSRFRILADKKKCISCNVCTSVCHQGIDIMNFANKGLAMQDPECVRCSACVQSCPTGVLTFGQVSGRTGKVIRTDPKWLAASPVLMREIHVNGKPLAV